jgi:AraC-like DNA-binding protein
MKRNLLFQLKGTCLRLLADASFGEDCADCARELDPALQTEEFFGRLISIAQRLCDRSEKRTRNRRSELATSILEYLDAAYVDPQLGLAQAADHFGLSEVYLSQFFKQEVGENFSTYVANVRLGQAQQLLADTDLPIDQVAQEVGYASTDTFRRAFRRTMGSTPSSFRHTTRSEGDPTAVRPAQ